MQISVTIEANAKGAGELRALADLLTNTEVVGEAPKKRGKAKPEPEEIEDEIDEAPKKRGRPKKQPEPEEEEIEDAEDVEEEGDESDDFEEEEEEDAEEENFASAADQKKIRAALSAYSKKHKRDKAVAILRKFGGASDRVLAKDVNKLLKALKV